MTKLTSNATYTGETFIDAQIAGLKDVTFIDCTFLSSSQEYGKFCVIRKCEGIRIIGGRIGPNSDVTDIYGMMIRDSRNVLIEGVEIAGVRYGLPTLKNDGLTVRKCRFHDLRTDGIQVQNTSNVLIEDNHFRDFRPAAGNHPDAIQIYNKSAVPMTGIVVRNNWIERGDGGIVQGVFVRAYAGFAKVEELTIEDNVVLGGMARGISVHGDAIVRRNTVIGYAGQRTGIISDDGKATIEGNTATWFYGPKDGVLAGNTKLPEDMAAEKTAALLAAEAPPPFSPEQIAWLDARFGRAA